jgi:predicted nuclease with TOPRIM domain
MTGDDDDANTIELGSSRLLVRLEEAQFEVELAREARRRLGAEVHRLEARLAAAASERESLRGRLEERERYVSAVHASAAWRLIQSLRGLVGRRW